MDKTTRVASCTGALELSLFLTVIEVAPEEFGELMMVDKWALFSLGSESCFIVEAWYFLTLQSIDGLAVPLVFCLCIV